MRRLAALVLCLAGLSAAGCGSDGAARPAVFAASSLTGVFEELDPSAVFNFAGSDELATQIREGARADVYAAASPRYPLELLGEGLVEEPVAFATNRLVLIVPGENPADIESVDDLRAPGVKLVVAAEGVPVGDYTRQALERLGAQDVLGNAVSEEEDVKGVAGKVALGEADAGFVYATDAIAVADDVRVIDLPAGARPVIEYLIAIVASGERPDAGEAFVQRVLGEEGRRALEAAGFGLP